jgi:hypothetical protein
METSTSFDLNLAIQRWRENLGQSPAFRSENLNELESHLRDSIATLQTRGLSAEESFTVAAKRIGRGQPLETEFAKVNAHAVWLDRILWMLIGVQVWAFVSSMTAISQTEMLFWLNRTNFNFTHGLTMPVVLAVLLGVLGFALSLGLCWWLIVQKGEGLHVGGLLHRQRTLKVAYAVLCMLPLLTYIITSKYAESLTTQILQAKSSGDSNFTQLIITWQYSLSINFFVQTAALIALTLFLARKRLRMSRDLSATC